MRHYLLCLAIVAVAVLQGVVLGTPLWFVLATMVVGVLAADMLRDRLRPAERERGIVGAFERQSAEADGHHGGHE